PDGARPHVVGADRRRPVAHGGERVMTPRPTMTRARQGADAVLYEGSLLYPDRASSPKNQVRWQFGMLGPAGAAEAGAGEETSMSAEVVVEARTGATVDAYVRFLQVQSRVVQRRTS